MEVLNPRASFLSNYEVLSLLRELDNDYLSRAKTAVRIKKEEDGAGVTGKGGSDPAAVDISENLRTVEVEAIQYLSADYQPIAQQSEAGIKQLTRDLAPYSLTKAEKLQIVNLAPTEPVELYVVVEELEDRLGEQMDDILSAVRRSLNAPYASPGLSYSERSHPPAAGEAEVYREEEQGWGEEVYDANEVIFDDTGEGAGVEGDLDMDDE
ncbi:hypothetical protein SERLA73DRAFT_74412 [Serpula lacrymans var. lacrymans S7.3]|uniref:DNA-directed RNA polymerase III subunit RPC9 n=2 Tax=Serpula lacrymans var. lacrymans TaxID=341189 RepID=F8Q1K5_SERL3|nr:uncharacterized protein SERLADRAFT_439067 [Serpula lacrymans var. lacrymans S7.9]EGN98183.1 hypothetical protein SERLA73DRAFT_74412 [Serpula lacrymans var. lacrymans S7.3]EGO23760.1 hypothetical protein SERLADRAFT_439067 [Serpula lacrymans var. lacrymans S7.9]